MVAGRSFRPKFLARLERLPEVEMDGSGRWNGHEVRRGFESSEKSETVDVSFKCCNHIIYFGLKRNSTLKMCELSRNKCIINFINNTVQVKYLFLDTSELLIIVSSNMESQNSNMEKCDFIERQ